MTGLDLTIVAPECGQVLDDKYRLVAKIGEGGMGVVYEAVHLKLAQRVAIKLLMPRAALPFERTRFAREARMAAKLRGPHVVRVFDVDETAEGIPFLVMELLAGRDLRQELAARGRLPVIEAIGYIRDVAEALAEAHNAGIVHRDLKPSNLFLADVDGQRILKLLDFGISKLQGSEEAITATDVMLGTPHYMSPEQTRNSREVDFRSDIWALGVILYQLVSNNLPFPGPRMTAVIAQIVADAPLPLPADIEWRDELQEVLARALAKDARDRYGAIQDLVEALGAIGRTTSGAIASPTIAPATFSPASPAPGSTRRRSLLARSVVGGLLFALAVFGPAGGAANTERTPAGPPSPSPSSAEVIPQVTAATVSPTPPKSEAAPPKTMPAPKVEPASRPRSPPLARPGPRAPAPPRVTPTPREPPADDPLPPRL